VVKVVEDGKGSAPCVVGIRDHARRVVRVAETGEYGGFAVAVAEIAEQLTGLVIAGDGRGVVAEVMVGVAETVPGLCLAATVAELLLQRQ
jgi:hypothetical protein